MAEQTGKQIRVTNGYIEQALNNPMFIEIFKKPFPMKPGYWLAKVVKKLTEEAQVYFTKRQEIIAKYAEKDEEGKPKSLKGPNSPVMWQAGVEEQVNNDFRELQEIEFSLDMNKVELDETCPDLTIEEQTLLEPLITMKQ